MAEAAGLDRKKHSGGRTGPRTPAGKAVVRLNGLRHGLLSEATLLPGESAEEILAGAAQLRQALAPHGAMEELLCDRIIASAWRLNRAQRVDAGLFTRELCELQELEVRKEAGRYERNAMKELFAEPAPTITDAAKHAEALRPLQEIEEALQETVPQLAQAFVRIGNTNDMLTKLTRYETTLERSLYRALHELQRLQAARLGQAVALPAAVDVTLSSAE
jgi:hypothetical protein